MGDSNAPSRDSQPVSRQRSTAVLIGNDGADAIDQIRQVIVEIKFGGIFHAFSLATERLRLARFLFCGQSEPQATSL